MIRWRSWRRSGRCSMGSDPVIFGEGRCFIGRLEGGRLIADGGGFFGFFGEFAQGNVFAMGDR